MQDVNLKPIEEVLDEFRKKYDSEASETPDACENPDSLKNSENSEDYEDNKDYENNEKEVIVFQRRNKYFSFGKIVKIQGITAAVLAAAAVAVRLLNPQMYESIKTLLRLA